jgi:hypothetical protein
MPKVLVQLNSLALGGSQINAVDLAAATAEHGYDCVLVGPKGSRPDGPSLVDVAGERARRAELGRFGRSFAAEHFGLPAMAQRLAEFYAHTLRTYRARDRWRDLPAELGYLPRRAMAGRGSAWTRAAGRGLPRPSRGVTQ